MAYKVFISYSTKDFHLVKHFRKLLTNPALEVFIAKYSVVPGTKIADNIVNAIKNCNLFILFWSQNSKNSEWVSQEIGIARAYKRTIIPLV